MRTHGVFSYTCLSTPEKVIENNSHFLIADNLLVKCYITLLLKWQKLQKFIIFHLQISAAKIHKFWDMKMA